MFSKPKSEPNTGQTTLGAATQPVSFVAPAADPRRSVLHDGIRIEGNWSSDGIVDFGGTIVGDLTADTIILTKTGKITGNIRARHVTIEGTVNGSISAYTLSISAGAEVQADIGAQEVAIDFGAKVNGVLSITGKKQQA